MIDHISITCVARLTAGRDTVLHGISELRGGEESLTAIDPQGAAFGSARPRK